MLPDRITQLLSAYVDGELNSRERRHVTRILRKSSEARQLLHKLKQDSMILRRLPRKKTQIDLTESAMGTISLRGLRIPKIETPPAFLAPPRAPKRSPRFWLAVALGVLLLVTLGIASYFFFAHTFQRTAQSTEAETPLTGDGPGDRPDPDRPLPVIGVLHEPESDTPPPRGVNPRKDERYGMTSLRVPPFVAAQPRLMPILAIRNLDQPPANTELLEELKKDNASRIDLFCQADTIPGLDRLQAACKAVGVTLRLDAYAQTRVKKRDRTNFALYCEDLSPEGWIALFQNLALEDKKSAAASQFDRLIVSPVTPAEMAKILGGEPSHYQQPARKGPLGVDVSQDVSSRTGNQILDTMSSQGRPASERQAVVVPYLPQPGFSREVRYIVENRKGWHPGAIQVLLILWNPN
jgi:hypothetical protein